MNLKTVTYHFTPNYNIMKRLKNIYSKLPFRLTILYILAIIFTKLLNKNIKISFSQYCEDLIFLEIFGNKKNGFFVDIGCNHPIDGNNMFNLYLRGWTGINIDGNLDLINLYKKYRSYDISICCLLSNKEELVNFYVSDLDKVSTISKETYAIFNQKWNYREENILQRKTNLLTNILNANLEKGQNIDILSIDVEGHDFEVLLGLDLNYYSPTIICIEIHNFNLINFEKDKIVKYLEEYNYSIKYYTLSNVFFQKNLI